jgi:ATP-dependent helicase/nuclease subunit B
MAGTEEVAAPVGVAFSGSEEAGAYLARYGLAGQAEELGLGEEYRLVREKAEHQLGAMERQQVRDLYGDSLTLSASQVDRQAECRMSYFLKYGMRAKERKEASVDPAEFGTYVHWVLENTAREVMEKGGFQAVSMEETMEIAFRYADEYAEERFSQLESSRLQYLFRRNRRELEMVVEELWRELKDARFAPAHFELAFGGEGALEAIGIPAKEMSAVLRGFVDRVDIWNEDGRNYFRVVDYKTGKKDFDYCDVFNGVGLQMLLYLFALEQNGAEAVGDHAKAAGVQYFPARAPLVSADGRLTDEEAEQLRRKEWKRRGLLLQDEDVLAAMEPGEEMSRLCCSRKKDGTLSSDLATREQLRLLERYVFGILGDMVDKIASGDVTPNPYTRGTSHDACAFCPYGAVCHKASVAGRRNYKAMAADRFWEEVEKEVQRRG